MTKNPDETGLYLHIPFCHARCGYCDFVTFTDKENQIDRYVEALCREIRAYAAQTAEPWTLSTVFFGGGTPSILEVPQIGLILMTVRDHFNLQPDAEITLEANPESVTPEKAEGWRAAGFNRLSIGLQSFD